jgi:hypothetical protein
MVGRSVFGSRNEREKDDLISILREEIIYLEKVINNRENILNQVRRICNASEHLVSIVDSPEPGYDRKVLVSVLKKLRTAVGYLDSE